MLTILRFPQQPPRHARTLSLPSTSTSPPSPSPTSAPLDLYVPLSPRILWAVLRSQRAVPRRETVLGFGAVKDNNHPPPSTPPPPPSYAHHPPVQPPSPPPPTPLRLRLAVGSLVGAWSSTPTVGAASSLALVPSAPSHAWGVNDGSRHYSAAAIATAAVALSGGRIHVSARHGLCD